MDKRNRRLVYTTALPCALSNALCALNSGDMQLAVFIFCGFTGFINS
jgi:hypothetical protein